MTAFTDLATAKATRAEGIKRLNAFLPHAGRRYTEWRNHDFGPDGDNAVSALSPWLRHRLISESEVIEAVIREHGLEAAEKYIQEVCWRSYWKGYLERRPVHWVEYQQQSLADRQGLGKDRRLAVEYEKAIHGDTGIECFDAWVSELVTHGYLHNHARMWFASIWVFTLELPWALGADFFMRHLLDGDPASNTLSWRWVAGLHTQGKNYLARASNIARFTNGRFQPQGQLTEDADTPTALEKPPLQPSPVRIDWAISPSTGLLITEEDLSPEQIFGQADWPLVVAVQATPMRSPDSINPALERFAREGLSDALARNAGRQNPGVFNIAEPEPIEALRNTLQSHGIQTLLTPWVSVGPNADAMAKLSAVLAADGIRIQPVPRAWDTALWPSATHGFFRFWKAARPLLEDGSLI